jgi:5-methylcytosine-specific restriction endonuclease McrA
MAHRNNPLRNPSTSPEARKKISDARAGKSTGSGPEHWNWQGKTLPRYCVDCGSVLKSTAWGKKSETKYCTKCSHKGDRHPMWKGGTTPQRIIECAKPEYKAFVRDCLVRDSYTCQWCGLKNGQGKTVKLEVHHIKSYAEYPALRLERSNGVTLCFPCHNTTKRGHRRPTRIDLPNNP